MNRALKSLGLAWLPAVCAGLLLAATAQAGSVTDSHGNVGYDTAEECDAAVAAGTARFYRSYTKNPPLERAGEVSVKTMKISDLTTAAEAAGKLGYDAANYTYGSCDLGVGRSNGRAGVARELIGKYVPFRHDTPINGYMDAAGAVVRATMQQCDNNFSGPLPRPVNRKAPAPAAVAEKPAPAVPVECVATILVPAKFETRTERVVKVPETKRYETVPPTYKTVTERVLVKPETRRQIPVPATYKTVAEEVVVRPAFFREEPVPATYKTVSEQVVVKPASTRLEVVPATYKTVTERVLDTAERKELRVIPAEYAEKEERIIDRPATTRVETVPATYKTVTERVRIKEEYLRYEPIELPLRQITERVLRSQASARLEALSPQLRTETERVMVKEASTRLVEVPAVFETVSERIKVADATREWKRGRAWVGQAVEVRPLRGFVVGPDGRVDGSRVAVPAAANPRSLGVVDTGVVTADNTNLDDDVMCLVEIPEQYQVITKQVLKTPATVREEVIPAEYATIDHRVLAADARTREIAIPETYQTVTRWVIDIEKLRAAGYKFDDKGDIIATPTGDRVLRAADVNKQGGVSAGANSGREGYVREITVPAEYSTITRQVVDRPATVRTVEVPATYKVVKTQVVSRPARTEEVVIPATYKTVTRQVVDRPATTREVAVPAVTRSVERRVVDVPATTRQIPVPAQTERIERRVIDKPATFREEVVPAEYKTIERMVVDTPASTREVVVPAQYETISYQVKVADAEVVRRAVLCETNATPAKIREIQTALRAAGFDPGAIDGTLRAATMSAVRRYQQAKGLPVDGYLNLDTVKSLGVSPD
ncbi:MAG: peptidoglycan-binding protein [Acidobacteriota bacterium]|nr:peptidoglycan-binding protein [Acidobacteriota bacterium]